MSNKIGSACIAHEVLISKFYANLDFKKVVSDRNLAFLWPNGKKSAEFTQPAPLDPVFYQKILRHNPEPRLPLGNQNQYKR